MKKGAAALPENEVLATMCAPSQEKMDEWLAAITRFHNCIVKPKKEAPEGDGEETEND